MAVYMIAFNVMKLNLINRDDLKICKVIQTFPEHHMVYDGLWFVETEHTQDHIYNKITDEVTLGNFELVITECPYKPKLHQLAREWFRHMDREWKIKGRPAPWS
ncbi:hypothetical protein [Entomobacter blattae]|uniref:Uncharacterized protein n=1 Tax=Entomobacter blattae TaxID=2762277 RepID=A0A7H1NU32_9PROT|nr:hypothetical protein [Entomobacter blattae]QNT79292.1 hypothetical protein JGUZn3_20890 [Entomobacter blattae]